jgi:hypothetical protein
MSHKIIILRTMPSREGWCLLIVILHR